MMDAVGVLAGVDAHAARQLVVAVLALVQAAQHGEHGGRVQHVRVQVDAAERRRRGQDQLVVDARLLAVVQRVRHLHDDHAVEQALVFALLQKLAELGQIGVRQDRLVQIDQRKARDLDVFLLRQRQQQVEEFALDLQDLDHFQHAAAGRIHRAGPRPRARVALVAVLGHLGQADRADQVGDIGGVRIVGRVGADGAAAGLGNEDALDRHAQEVAGQLVFQPRPAVGAQLAGDLDVVSFAEAGTHRVRHQMQRRFVHRAAGDAIQRALVGVAVLLEAAFEPDHQGGLAARRGPSSSNRRRPTSEPAAAALK